MSDETRDRGLALIIAITVVSVLAGGIVLALKLDPAPPRTVPDTSYEPSNRYRLERLEPAYDRLLDCLADKATLAETTYQLRLGIMTCAAAGRRE